MMEKDTDGPMLTVQTAVEMEETTGRRVDEIKLLVHTNRMSGSVVFKLNPLADITQDVFFKTGLYTLQIEKKWVPWLRVTELYHPDLSSFLKKAIPVSLKLSTMKLSLKKLVLRSDYRSMHVKEKGKFFQYSILVKWENIGPQLQRCSIISPELLIRTITVDHKAAGTSLGYTRIETQADWINHGI